MEKSKENIKKTKEQLIERVEELVEFLNREHKEKLPDHIKMEIDDIFLHLFKKLKDSGFYLDYNATIEMMKILTIQKRRKKKEEKKKYIKVNPLVLNRIYELIEQYGGEVEQEVVKNYDEIKKETEDLLIKMMQILRNIGYRPSESVIINIFKIFWCSENS